MKRLILFDFDNTLIKSEACVKVVDADNNVVASFKDDSFRSYKLKEGEELNFDDMESAEVLKTARLTPYWNTMLDYINEGEAIVILTSRGNKQIVWDFMTEHGVAPLGIEAVNSVRYTNYRHLPNAERKKLAVKNMWLRGVSEFIYYDDDIANLDAVASLKGPKITTHLVKI